MSAAAVEKHHAWGQRPLLAMAEEISEKFPGHRVEILGGQVIVTPPADGPHGESLTDVMLPLIAAGVHGGESRVIQALGLWLPSGEDDYAIPDLSVVDADYQDHLIEYNSYDPAVFRMVLEVTSSNYRTDLRTKVALYAEAGIPVYVIVDRKHQRVHVLTDPHNGEYEHTVHAPGSTFTLPLSIGAEVKLSVDILLRLKPAG
ncbi:Uma2 family endonuclease [Streptomyces sp. AV19]|uniref:Uma2 family endonuclease n=1 Tax=Streptomyces sp. AV19 TaxID=2793068 RepID=UPI0018FECD44|nr:Uma2 family endonuclease [Streptomyces sp. AV19]MBH1935577.1 Uma2 family endonuclease [Streptomyces sp. AV19]MDG4534464.1 Uma2 family endonuclease [Streptomyces sp. AV19]